MITLPRVASRIFGEPLAIDHAKLEVIVNAVGPRLKGMPMDDPEETASRQPCVVGADGIACIDISGTLVAKCSGMAAMSGLTSYSDIAADFSSAINDPSCRGIMLSIDSPGGEVAGMFDLADMMYQARGQKPVCAVVSCAASAAYLLASAADVIVVSRTGITGSVGIIAMHLDESRADEQAGLKYTAIFAGERKTDGNPHEPLSPDARSNMQARVDTVYGMFTSAVARNRGMAETAVRKTQAGVYMGQDGVTVGFADAVGNMDDASRALSTAFQRGMKSLEATSFISSAASAALSHKEGNSMADNIKTAPAEATIPTAADIEAMVAQARTEGFSAAAEIVDLCAIAGTPVKAAQFIQEKKTVAQVRESLLAARVETQKGTELNTSVMPGVDAKATPETQGKAKPWGEILSALGIKKGGK